MILKTQPNEAPAPAVLILPTVSGKAGGSFMEFMKVQFFSLLLLVVFFALLGVMFHAMHHQTDASTVTWLQQKCGETLAALLTLATVRAATQRNGDKNGDKNTNGANS